MIVATKQHEVFSVNLSTYRVLSQKCFFPVLAFHQEAILFFFSFGETEWKTKATVRQVNVYVHMAQVSTHLSIGANLHEGLGKLEITVNRV